MTKHLAYFFLGHGVCNNIILYQPHQNFSEKANDYGKMANYCAGQLWRNPAVQRRYDSLTIRGREYKIYVAILQDEAELLKNVIQTKVIAVGIGQGVGEVELNIIASEPQDTNVILVPTFENLAEVQDLLQNASCTGH